MKAAVVSGFVLALAGAVLFGVVTDRLLLPQPAHIWMPIRLEKTDISRLIVLQEKGGTYTRYAKPDGEMGIVAVKQNDSIWIVPSEETSK
jgi:hypothetical protein